MRKINNDLQHFIYKDDGEKIAGVFISQQDAEEFINQLAIKNPELAEKVKVVPVSLEEVYVFICVHLRSSVDFSNFLIL